MILKGLHLLLVDGCLLEFHPLRSLGHQGPVVPDDFLPVSLQQADDFLDVFAVLLAGNSPDAASPAFPDVEIQTGPELAPQDGLGGDFVVAGTQGVEPMEKFQKVSCVHHAAVRSEVARTVLHHAPCQEDFRKLIRADADPRIGLGILQKDVVLRLVLLDEIVFKQQGIRLGVHDGVLCIGNPGDHQGRLSRQSFRRHEILGNPLVQVLGLAYINNLPLGVIVSVDFGGMREQCYFFSQRHLPRASFTAASIPSPRRSLLRMVPSGPKSIICGMP